VTFLSRTQGRDTNAVSRGAKSLDSIVPAELLEIYRLCKSCFSRDVSSEDFNRRDIDPMFICLICLPCVKEFESRSRSKKYM